MFAYLHEISGEQMEFKAFDGFHNAIIEDRMSHNLCDVSLSMADVDEVHKSKLFYFLDTGSPHYVEFVEQVAELDVVSEGRKTRHSERFMPDGTNVNFVEIRDERLFVRTYERGVEDETLACGTGSVAGALVHALQTGADSPIDMVTRSGNRLTIHYEIDGETCKAVYLEGDARVIYTGNLTPDAWQY